jgi:hypothetical protein
MYSSENMHKVMDKVLDNLPPEIREGLSQLFNALSGALSGDEPAKSQEYETIREVYGTGGTDNESVRMNSNFAQRDDAQFAAAVTIGNGSGAITEVNGIQYVNGKPVNDGEDDDAEALQEMSEQMERDREEQRMREWDNSMSREYAGMKEGEVLDMLRKINSNMSYYSNKAVEQGLIKKEDKPAWETFMRNELWLKEQERLGKTDTPEYRERKKEQEQVSQQKPEYRKAAQAVSDLGHANSLSKERMQSQSVIGEAGTVATTARTYSLEVDAESVDKSRAVKASVASQIDMRNDLVSGYSEKITNEFNQKANGSNAEPIMVAQSIQPKQAIPALDMNAGMI